MLQVDCSSLQNARFASIGLIIPNNFFLTFSSSISSANSIKLFFMDSSFHLTCICPRVWVHYVHTFTDTSSFGLSKDGMIRVHPELESFQEEQDLTTSGMKLSFH